MKKLISVLILLVVYCNIGFAEVSHESPKMQILRQELENQINDQANEAYYQLQERELEYQTENIKIKKQLNKMQQDIEELKDSRNSDYLR
jgi:hypothetical protein